MYLIKRGLDLAHESRESRKIFGENETTRQDQSRGLESRLQALGSKYLLGSVFRGLHY